MYHIPTALTRRAGAALMAWLRDPAGRLVGAFAAERDRTFLAAPVALGSGIAIYFAVPFEPSFLATLAAVCFAAMFLWAVWRSSYRGLGWAFVLVALGLFLAILRTEWIAAPILPASVGPAELAGTVIKVDRRSDTLRLTVRPSRIGALRREHLPDRVRVSVRSTDSPVRPGDNVVMLTSLKPPSAPAEPGAFDFQRHAFYRSIGGYGFAMGTVTVTPGPEGAGAFNRFRDAVAVRIAANVGEPSGGIAAALVTGDRSRITEAQQQALRNSGLAHLLAISGLHMGLVTGFLFFGLRALLAAVPTVALRYPIKKWAAMAALAGGFGYLILTGGSVPTIRAFVMVAIVMLAVVADRRAISLRTVAIAALLVLVMTPEALVEPGFQMSFAAVTALIAAYEAYGDRWRGRFAYNNALARASRYLLGVAMTTLIAGAATGPFAIYHFGRFADYGVLANLFAIPVVAFWVMPSATIGALLMPVGLEQPFFWIMGQGIEIVMTIATWVSDLPGAVRLVPAMPIWGLMAVSLGGLWLCLMSRTWRYWGLIAISLGLLSPHLSERPLIRVDANARLFAVRTDDGQTMLSSKRREKFTAGQWLARDAETASAEWPRNGASEDRQMRCDIEGCILRLYGWMIALPMSQSAIVEDCRRADIVISLEPVSGRCPSARIVVDRFDIWRDGAHALWIDSTAGPTVRSADGVRGARPWNPDPLPAKDQYWRNSAASRP